LVTKFEVILIVLPEKVLVIFEKSTARSGGGI
jgi:hypothetical protein